MPLSNRSTLTQYLIEERRRFPNASGALNALILDVALACKAIARAVAFGELGDAMGGVDAAAVQGGAINVQGEEQKKLDVLSNEVFIRRNEWSGCLAGMASEEMEAPYQIPASTCAATTCWCSTRSTDLPILMSTVRSALSFRSCAAPKAQ